MSAPVQIIFRGDAKSAVAAAQEAGVAIEVAGKAADHASQRFSSFGNTIGAASQKAQHALGAIAKGATLVAGVGVAGGLIGATAAAVSFDRAMRNVNSLAQLNEKQFASLEKQVLSLSKATGQAPKTLAEGLYDIQSSGFAGAGALKILEASAKSATAGLTDTATSAKVILSVLNAYHLGADKAKTVSDELFQTVNDGVLNFEQLANSLGQILPTANILGVNLKTVGAAMAELTLQGNSADESATQIERLFTSLGGKATPALRKEFKAMGYETGQVAIAHLGFAGVLERLSKDAGGSQEKLHDWLSDVRAIRGFNGIAGSSKAIAEFNKLLEHQQQASDGAGATAKAYSQQVKSISFQWDRSKAALIAAAVPIGQVFFPALSAAAGKLGEFAGFLEKVDKRPTLKAKVEFVGQGAEGLAEQLFHGLEHQITGYDRKVPINLPQHFKVEHVDGLWQSMFGDDSFKQAFTSAVEKGLAHANLSTLAHTAASGPSKTFGQTFFEDIFSVANTATDPTFIAQHIGDILGLALLAVPVGRLAALMRLRWLEILVKPLSGLGEFLIRGTASLGHDFVTGLAGAFGRNLPAVERAAVGGLKGLPGAIRGSIHSAVIGAGVEAGEFVTAGGRLASRLVDGTERGLSRLGATVADEATAAATSLPGLAGGAFAAAGGAIAGMFTGAFDGPLNAIISKIQWIASHIPGLPGGGGAQAPSGNTRGARGGGLPPAVQGGPGTGGSTGGKKRAAGGDITGPTLVLAGENPAYPREWFITPDPAHRPANLAYWLQAGKALGIVPAAAGAAIGPSGLGTPGLRRYATPGTIGFGVLLPKPVPPLDPAIARNAAKLNAYARAAGTQATEHADRVTGLERTYEQQQAEYSAHALTYIRTDATGAQYVDQNAVATGQARYRRLIGLQRQIKTELGAEQTAIAKQRSAWRAKAGRLRTSMNAQRAKVRQTAQQIAAARREQRQVKADLAAERRKKKPNKARINALSDRSTKLSARIQGLQTLSQSQKATLQGFQSQLADAASQLSQLGESAGSIPYDIRDAQVEIESITQQAATDAATSVDQPTPDTPDPTAIAPDIALAVAEAQLTPDTADDRAALLRQQANLSAILAGANGPLTNDQRINVLGQLRSTIDQIAGLDQGSGASAAAAGPTADDTATLNQANLRAQMAQQAQAASDAALAAFGSPGDVFTGGYRNAYGAAAQGLHVIITSDPRTVAMLGSVAVQGMGYQGATVAPRAPVAG